MHAWNASQRIYLNGWFGGDASEWLKQIKMRLSVTELLTEEMEGNAAAVGMVAMFPEINALPGAEGEMAAFEGNAEVDGGKRRADVSGHVVFPFGGVLEDRITVRREAGKDAFEVAAHFRIGIFLNEQRRRCVLKVESGDARLQCRLPKHLGDLIGQVIKAAAPGWNFQMLKQLAH